MASISEPDAVFETVAAVARRIVGSKLLMVTAFGFALIGIGKFLLSGTLAGMFGIWGATFVLVGVVGLAVFFVIYRPD